jgi:hypothetical protein
MALGGSLNSRERSVDAYAEESVKRSAAPEGGGQHASRKFKRSIVKDPSNTGISAHPPRLKGWPFLQAERGLLV